MQLRIKFINTQLGPKVISPDPIGINEISKSIKRSLEHEGVMYEIVLDLKFIKGGREYLKKAYETAGGLDAVVVVEVYRRNTNEKHWRLWTSNQVNFNMFAIDEEIADGKLEQVGIERTILNQIDKNVNLETSESENGTALVPLIPLDITYHSKKIRLQFEGEIVDEETSGTPTDTGLVSAGTAYFQSSFETTLDEVSERIDYPFGQSNVNPVTVKKYNWKVKFPGSYHIVIPRLVANVVPVSGEAGNWTVKYILKYGRENAYTEVVLSTETKLVDDVGDTFIINEEDIYDQTLNFVAGDQIYLYASVLNSTGNAIAFVFRNFIFDGPAIIRTSMTIDAATTFQETEVKTVLLHEAVEKCCQYYTNEEVCFYSELLGRVDLGYAVDGEASIIGWTNGQRLRGKNNKKIFANLGELIEFINARFCTGYGFETVDDNGCLIGTEDTGIAPGTKVFRIEKREHFYQKNTRIVSLGRVYKVKKRVDSKRYYSLIKYGYNIKLDIDQVNAIDEFNTLRESSIPVIATKNVLDITTSVITGGYPIESQRRLLNSTEDGKHDDDNFAINLIRDEGEDSGYRTRTGTLADGFVLASFSNIYDPETGYNYYLSPARFLKAWEKVIAASLIRSFRNVVKFNSGDVNYELTSQIVGEQIVAENGNLDLTTVEAIHDPEIYTFVAPITLEEMELIDANPYGYFDFTDYLGNMMEGFINTDNGIDIEPDGKTMFELLKVNRV